MANYWRKW